MDGSGDDAKCIFVGWVVRLRQPIDREGGIVVDGLRAARHRVAPSPTCGPQGI
jgi:hypothetical protein